MKLTKEQILAFYLPFGLKYISVNENGGDLDYKGKIRKPIHISFDEDLCNSKLWKPLLRPLSSLTIEQEINGERVVPIVGLLKKATSQIWGEPIEIIETPEMLTEGDSSGIIAYNDTERVSLTVDFNEIQRDFSLYIDGGKMMLDKLSLFTQLLSWHFNVFNLPEDEYVDINNLKK